MSQGRNFKCYYRDKNAGDLLQKFVVATSAEKAGEFLTAMGIHPLSIVEVESKSGGSPDQLAPCPQGSSPGPDPSQDEARVPRAERKGQPQAGKESQVPKRSALKVFIANVLRGAAMIILLVITLFVNAAGYTPGAWILGVLMLVPTFVPLFYFAEKLDPRT